MEDKALKPFKTIVITAPGDTPDEVRIIERLLRSGAADIVHIRKPEASPDEIRQLLLAIPADLHPRLRLHSHFSLCEEFAIGGIHLNKRFPIPPAGYRHISRSCHSLEEISGACSPYEYVTLSPIFDSISKEGYRAAFSPEECAQAASSSRIVALGGVEPEHLGRLRKAGFYGAALLGAVWNAPDGADAAAERLARARAAIDEVNNPNQ